MPNSIVKSSNTSIEPAADWVEGEVVNEIQPYQAGGLTIGLPNGARVPHGNYDDSGVTYEQPRQSPPNNTTSNILAFLGAALIFILGLICFFSTMTVFS